MTNRMRRFRQILAVGLCCSMSPIGWAQSVSIEPVRPVAPILWRPYLPATVPPVRLTNSSRLHDLIRAGTLYLTVQDAIALALENNIDIEVARYNPILADWQLERAQAGGALPGVPSGASQAGSVASGQGVAGSQAAAGVSAAGGGGGAGRGGNATISQVGPVTQNLDPIFQETTSFSHTSTPQFNVTQSSTNVLITATHVYTGSLQQGLLSGGSVSVSYSDHYLKENAPSDLLNPSVAPILGFSVQHNLLRGFGTAVNGRTITVSKINVQTSELSFKSQVIGIVVNVLNLYYGLAAAIEDVKAKQSALDLSQTLYEDNKKQVQIGSLAPLDITNAESQVAANRRDLLISQTTQQQQELRLKNVLSRTGLADPLLASAHILPVDRLAIPEQDNLPPIESLVQTALANRSDLALQKANLNAAEISALGTKNGILPSLQVFGGESQAGLAGVPHTVVSRNGQVQRPDAYFVGGIGTALGEVFRRNFPTERVGAFFQTPIYNRQAQADYGIDQLSLRQSQLSNQKSLSQVEVDLLSAVVALRQARVRYDAAVKNRTLQQELLSAEQKKLSLGSSTPFNVIQQQRDLAAAQSGEISAIVSYNNARVALDQTLGTTLESNHISIAEAKSGRVASAPAALPDAR
ncbi:MAG TPA: TolC family protein [Bryobacteraceae bacterium]|nr:TolC family protein [Bryobacteraceae bacterium]